MHHHCGVAAIYHQAGREVSPLLGKVPAAEASRLLPRMLLDIQNRGQLSAGLTSYSPLRPQLLVTYKDLGTVQEVFRMGHQGKYRSLMEQTSGMAAIGHVRYATCGREDRSYAQPFERQHLQKHKWFAFAFNGQLANYSQLRQELLEDEDNYLARETDTEIILHAISHQFSGDRRPDLVEVMRQISAKFDGAYCLVLLNALGHMLVARDPLGIRPLCWARRGPLFAAASESVALLNLGFRPEEIQPLEPGWAIVVTPEQFRLEQFASSPRQAHCFFEWVYFANVASTLDGQSVYLSRTRLGEELARLEDVPIDHDTIVVPVPDTSKAAADAMAYRLNIPAREGLIRNRYLGRTFIEGSVTRAEKAALKYTPLPEVLQGKRVLLVEDSIVRSTTMRVLLDRIRRQGKAREVHVRVACPPIVAPCFYGIDMADIEQLFAPKFLHGNFELSEEDQRRMAHALGADSLRYLPVEAVARAIGFSEQQLCQACLTGEYPTPWGRKLYQLLLSPSKPGSSRAYEQAPT